MTIRPATAADIPAVLPLVARACAFHEGLDPSRYCFVPEPERRYGRWMEGLVDDPRSVFLVAEREEGIAGFIVGTMEREIGVYRLREYGFVHELWVEPDYRHEGVGRQLIMRAVERFREIGAVQVRLDVVVSNEPAKALFHACGFRPATMQMIYELDAMSVPGSPPGHAERSEASPAPEILRSAQDDPAGGQR